MFKPGDIVETDGLLAAVTGTPEDGGAPEGHLKLWFGERHSKRISQGGAGGHRPEFWTVPSEYCNLARDGIVKH
jgi:hypothetical protein